VASIELVCRFSLGKIIEVGKLALVELSESLEGSSSVAHLKRKRTDEMSR
jgi:hypothetical protein